MTVIQTLRMRFVFTGNVWEHREKDSKLLRAKCLHVNEVRARKKLVYCTKNVELGNSGHFCIR
jgi:hypothetical protein